MKYKKQSALFKFVSILAFVVQLANSRVLDANEEEFSRFYFEEAKRSIVSQQQQQQQQDLLVFEGAGTADDSNQPLQLSTAASSDKSVENVTVKVGQQATLPCFVNNLSSYKVIWAKNGDILALGSTKINSDVRLVVQHRYVSEWHLVIDNVLTDDEGEYICKTNGNFYKTINLHVLMPPTIDDANSTPVGTITLKEGASITLRCYADGKPTPTIKWYRWKKYKHLVSEKEELSVIGNEINIESIGRNDANIYECIAKNSVPPATTRVFNIEIHFLPTVELEIRKTFQFLNRKFSLECKISSNPLEKAYWYKNGQILGSQTGLDNIRVDRYDISNINDYYKTFLTLIILNARKEDFGEYQCCATNAYGQTCSNILVQEIKPEIKTTSFKLVTEAVTSARLVTQSVALTSDSSTTFQEEKSKTYNTSGKRDEPNIVKNEDDDAENLNNDDDSELSSLNDSKDKRRHYLIKSKQFLQSESQPATSWSIRLAPLVSLQLMLIFLAINI